MKKLLTATVLMAVCAGCATGPLMQSKMDWARQNARQYGYVPVHSLDGTRYVPRGVAQDKGEGEALQTAVAIGEVRSFTDAELAQQMDPSGVWWRKAGDTSILATAVALATWGASEVASEINDSSSSSYSERTDQRAEITGDGNVVVIGGNQPTGSRDTVMEVVE